jgi:predicted glycosyltransferase
MEGIELPKSVRRKLTYTGYLPRTLPHSPLPRTSEMDGLDRPYLLVTPGGGGDGEELVDWVLSAYEHDPAMPDPAVVVLGPFMAPEHQGEFMRRAQALPNVRMTTFDAHMEPLIANARGVVAMGGYNTFCEILSFDKRAVIVPRTVPRLEQHIRASRAQELGLVRVLANDGVRDPRMMATALRHLPQQSRPSDVVVPGLLDGINNVNRLVTQLLARGKALPQRRFAARGR